MIENECAECGCKASDGYALYCVKCSEPMRDWVGLTENEIEDMANDFEEGYIFLYRSFAAAIEAKLKEKNT